jgi:hypothetical protein
MGPPSSKLQADKESWYVRPPDSVQVAIPLAPFLKLKTMPL